MAWHQKLVDYLKGLQPQGEPGLTLDWALVDIVKGFIEAVYERKAAMGLEGYEPTTVNVGDDVQLYTFWRNMQDFFWADVVNADSRWCRRKHLVAGEWVKWAPPYYYTNAGFVTMPTWALWDGTPTGNGGGTRATALGCLLKSAGCDPQGRGFRRVPGLNYPANWRDFNDPAYYWGDSPNFIEPGDILGPWILDDLFRLLNEVIWQVKSNEDPVTPYTEWVLISPNRKYQEGWGDLPTAKINAVNNWINAPLFATTEGVTPPAAANIVGWVDPQWFGSLWRWRAPCRFWEKWAGASADADFYALTYMTELGDEHTFSNFDDPQTPPCPHGWNFSPGEYVLWATETGIAGAEHTSTSILGDFEESVPGSGADVPIPWAPDPSNYIFFSATGWRVDPWGCAVVLRWDVSGGFEYQEPDDWET